MLTILMKTGVVIYIIAIIAIILNDSRDLIQIIICLELCLLSLSVLALSVSVILDDITGVTITLYQLPLAGGESAFLQGQLLRFYPERQRQDY